MSLSGFLHHRWGPVRKGASAMLTLPRAGARLGACDEAYAANPAVVANSFPKSGTHLLEQALSALPNRRNYGTFISAMSSSHRFRPQSAPEIRRQLRRIVPCEVVRAHLAYDSSYVYDLTERRAVHYLIYRDPRDVVVSEAHYLRSMNRWHRLHPTFRDFPSLDDAISAAIEGLNERQYKLYYPNIAERYGAYLPWIDHPAVCAVRFEDLQGADRRATLERIAEFYARRLAYDVNLSTWIDRMEAALVPTRSHTFRQGGAGGWRTAFTDRHHELFDQLSGDLLQRLGYALREESREASWKASRGGSKIDAPLVGVLD